MTEKNDYVLDLLAVRAWLDKMPQCANKFWELRDAMALARAEIAKRLETEGITSAKASS